MRFVILRCSGTKVSEDVFALLQFMVRVRRVCSAASEQCSCGMRCFTAMREINQDEISAIVGGDWRSQSAAVGGAIQGGLTGAAAGAAVGAAVGTFVAPAIGTAVGAGIGATLGGIGGAIAGAFSAAS